MSMIGRRGGVALFAAFATLALGACTPFAQRGEPLVVYSPEPAGARAAPGPAVDWQLVVARPVAERVLSSPRIAVRPAGSELQVLAGARWSDSVPELLQTLAIRAFEDSGRIVGVGRQSSAMRADLVLLLDVRAFEADYRGGGAPRARVEVGARLLSLPGNRVLAARAFEAGAEAEGRDAAAVVHAFERALGPLLAAVVDWTLVTGEANATAVPRPPGG